MGTRHTFGFPNHVDDVDTYDLYTYIHIDALTYTHDQQAAQPSRGLTPCVVFGVGASG